MLDKGNGYMSPYMNPYMEGVGSVLVGLCIKNMLTGASFALGNTSHGSWSLSRNKVPNVRAPRIQKIRKYSEYNQQFISRKFIKKYDTPFA